MADLVVKVYLIGVVVWWVWAAFEFHGITKTQIWRDKVPLLPPAEQAAIKTGIVLGAILSGLLWPAGMLCKALIWANKPDKEKK